MRLPQWQHQYLSIVLFASLVSAQNNDEKSHSTSVAGMVQLLQLESNLIENLSNYANELEKKLKIVRSFTTYMSAENGKANNRTLEYLSNPLNAFSLIRRMQQDWTRWQHYMEQPVGQQEVEYIQLHRAQLPTSTDLEEAADSIDRIQSTYNLQVSDMVKGLLNGRQYNVSLNALDTHALGNYYYDQKRFGDASQWIFQTINWLKGSNELPLPLKLNRAEVLHVYAETLIQMNRYTAALKILSIASSLKNTNIKLMIRKSEVEALIRMSPDIKPKPYNKLPSGDYERGCRGLFSKVSSLYCTYNNTNSPFLRYAPLKMELIGLDPYIVLYHDVLASSEISELQTLAVPDLKRATVLNLDTGKSNVVKTRTSKVTWLPDNYNALTVRLNRRIVDMTAFDISGSEMLQIMNYGIGGHYAKHVDYLNATVSAGLTKLNGDRIATVLFYLTDVEQGGATVFPHLKKAIFPQRGTAVIWYNLKNDGEGDTRTLHAACPVIVGSKWVCNKWVRERQQLFNRPCYKK